MDLLQKANLQCGAHANTRFPILTSGSTSDEFSQSVSLINLSEPGNLRFRYYSFGDSTTRLHNQTSQCLYQASARPLLSDGNFGVGKVGAEAEEVVGVVGGVEEAAGAAVVAAQGLSVREARAKVFLPVAKGPVPCPLFLLGNHFLGGVKVVERGETSTGTGKCYGSNIIYRSKVLIYYRRAYGSGYPGIAGKGTVGRGFPFFFWPLAFGTAGLGGAYHYHSDVGALDLHRGWSINV